jgi:hypothetical protein
MNNFIKTFERFSKEYLTENVNQLPKEVEKSAKNIIDDNFEKAFRLKINGDILSFKATENDFKWSDTETLNMDLSTGASNKREFDVKLVFVDKIKDKDNGGELIYKIEYKPKDKNSPVIEIEDDDADVEVKDDYKTSDEDDDLTFDEEPIIKKGKKRKGKSKNDIFDLDSHFRTGDSIYLDDDEDDDEPIKKPVKKPVKKLEPIKKYTSYVKPIVEPINKTDLSTSDINDLKLIVTPEELREILLKKLAEGPIRKRDLESYMNTRLPDILTPKEKNSKIENGLWALRQQVVHNKENKLWSLK